MTNNFHELLEKLSILDETITNQKLASTFSDKSSYENTLRVFNKLKMGAAENLNEDDRLMAAKLLKILLPSISSDMVYNAIISHSTALKKEKEAQEAAASQNSSINN